jgi:hypothetical protein
MVNKQLKKKVYNVLKRGYFNGPDDAVDIWGLKIVSILSLSAENLMVNG